MVKKYWFPILLTICIIIFGYFRLKPIYFQTVGYTYDQGRDFLKAAEIVLYKNLTFIGPTTGIAGLYHGAWWFYLLTVPFTLFNGWPQGFYYFNFIIQLVSLIVLALFTFKYINKQLALIISLVISLSGYFRFTSTFVGNNIMVLPVLLGFILVNFLLLEKKSKKTSLLLFLSALFLGFVAEFEFSFGLFIIPSYIVLAVLLPQLRNYFKNIKNILISLSGLTIAFIPRILFELKHDFMQTRTLISFFFKPKLYNPKSFQDVLYDRIQLFIGYFRGSFPNDLFALLFFIFGVGVLILALKHKRLLYRSSVLFYAGLLGLLFFFSSLYKDNFWSNYYEGIHYIILFLVFIILASYYKIHKKYFYWLSGICIAVLFGFAWLTVIKEMPNQPGYNGMKMQSTVVDYIHNNQNTKNSYCVKIYTPPVIPYTYDYLFLYKKLSQGIQEPVKEAADYSCWYIVEKDDNVDRQKKWISENIPQGKQMKKQIFGNVTTFLWVK